MVFFSNIAGKSEVVSEEMIAPCTEATLTTILSRYPLENIFSADKFGLLYLCQTKPCILGEINAHRLTVLAGRNALGKGLCMFVICKAQKPRYFKGIKHLPC